MLVTTKELLIRAKKEKYAVPALNANCLEMCLPLVRAAEKLRAPLILQLGRQYLQFMTPAEIAPTAIALAKSSSVPIAIHLDHAKELKPCVDSLAAGFTSIMFDGSSYSFEENIAMTQKVVAEAKKYNVPVEGEVGKVGLIETTDLNNITDKSTPEEVVEFVSKTGVDSVAVAVGNVHRMRRKIAKLDFELIEKLSRSVDIPLVMHGASGISDEDVRRAIECGISKVNVATDFNVAFTNGLKEDVSNNPEETFPMEFMKTGMKNVYETAIERILAVKADGKY